MTRKHVFLLLTIIGFIVPNWIVVSIIIQTGTFDFAQLLNNSYKDPYTTFVAADFLITAAAGIVLYISDWRAGKLPKRFAWAPLVGSVLVGIAFGFPLYLYLREE